MTIVKIRELIGTSSESFEEALQNIVEHEAAAGKQVTGVHVVNQTAEVKDGKITEFKVNAKVAYKWEK
ncbi:dodecin family protein [Patescibacteria group bacterium]|nr:dodecin family protein [Patescibacteria group bacterium]